MRRSREEAGRYCCTPCFFDGSVSVVTESRAQSRAFLMGLLSFRSELPIDPENDSQDGIVEYMYRCRRICGRSLESWYEPRNGYWRDVLESDYPEPMMFGVWQAGRLIHREVVVYAETDDDVDRMISFIDNYHIPWKSREGISGFLPGHYLEFAYILGAYRRRETRWVPDGLWLPSTGFVPHYTYDENGRAFGHYVEATSSAGREDGGMCVSGEKGIFKKLDDDYGRYSPVSVASFLVGV